MIRSLIIFCFLFLGLNAFGQDSLIADTPSASDSVIFVSHTVVKGETIYGICRQYGISQEELVKFNPILQEGLKIGQVLTVPVYPALDEEPPAQDQAVILHRVKKGQTIYSICKNYDITEEQLYAANGFLKEDGLRPGQLLRIPVDIDPFASAVDPDTVQVSVPIDLEGLRRSGMADLKFALILPLYLNMNDSLEVYRDLDEEEQIYARSRIGLEFYTGFKMVLDSLSELGQNITLDVFDTGGQEGESMTDWLRFTDWSDYQLVLGPLYTENVERMAEYFTDKGIKTPILVPYSKEAGLFYRHSGLVQLTPSEKQMNLELCSRMIRAHGMEHIHVVTTDSAKDSELSSDVISKLYLYLDSAQVHVHRLTSAAKLDLEPFKNGTSNKVIFLATYDKVLVTDLMRRVNGLRMDNIILYGPQWVHTMDIESVYLNNLHFHFPSAEYCDYPDSTLVPWIRRYRKDFYADVTRFSLTGIDLAMYGAEILSAYTEFLDPAQAENWKGFQTSMQLRAIRSGSLINKHVYILRYENFEIIPQEDPRND